MKISTWFFSYRKGKSITTLRDVVKNGFYKIFQKTPICFRACTFTKEGPGNSGKIHKNFPHELSLQHM